MDVPEATMDKQCDLSLGKQNVRAPGTSFLYRRNRNPAAGRARLTMSSRRVCFPLTPEIISPRVFESTTSAKCSPFSEER